jgi:hypothetical protein
MLPDILGLGLSLILSAVHAAESLPVFSTWPPNITNVAASVKTEPPAFWPVERAVSNWRREAFWNAALPLKSAFRLALGKDPEGVSRCVKLNNYWCIKKAGWNGEIAADAEGHVAFASALEGAAVAALLLRRYYVDYNRHSAFAIISRWAPAQCGFSLASRPRGFKVASAANTLLRDVAPRGIQNTLRARWLASHSSGGVAKGGKPSALRPSVIPDRLLKMMPAPEIAVGMGEREIKLKPFALNLLGSSKSLPFPMTSCAADGPRVEAYANRAAEGIAADANDDLHLFTETGAPTPNLAHMMDNMALVEIGPLAARSWLIDAGIAAALHRGPKENPKADAASAPRP